MTDLDPVEALTGPLEGPGDQTPAARLDRVAAALAEVVDRVGRSRVVEETDLAPASVEAIEAGDVADLDLETAAAVLALAEGAPDARGLQSTVRDHLLLGMSSAMLTVDRIAAEVAGDLDPKEVQAMVEGRHPMTLAEYARIDGYVTRAA